MGIIFLGCLKGLLGETAANGSLFLCFRNTFAPPVLQAEDRLYSTQRFSAAKSGVHFWATNQAGKCGKVCCSRDVYKPLQSTAGMSPACKIWAQKSPVAYPSQYGGSFSLDA